MNSSIFSSNERNIFDENIFVLLLKTFGSEKCVI
jgi:hypothetical protein